MQVYIYIYIYRTTHGLQWISEAHDELQTYIRTKLTEIDVYVYILYSKHIRLSHLATRIGHIERS